MKLNIQKKLSLYFSLLSVVLFSILTGISYSSQKKSTTEAVLSELSVQVARSAVETESWFLQRKSVISTIAAVFSREETFSAMSSYPGNLNPFLILNADTAYFDSVYIGTPDKKFYIGIDWIPEEGWDPTGRPWYGPAVDARTTVFSEYYIDADTGLDAMSISSPVYNEERELKGVLGVDIYLTELVEKFTAMQEEFITVVLLDEKGTVLAHPDKNVLKTSVFDNSDMREVYEDLFRVSEGYRYYEEEGEEKLIVYDEIPATGWEILYYVDLEIINAPLRTLAWTYFIFTLVSVLCVVVLSSVIARFFARRIESVAGNLREISSGRLYSEVDSRNLVIRDEIGDLTRSLVSMTEQLSGVITAVRAASSQVASASAELSSGNMQLSTRTEHQATSLEETSAAIEEMNSSIRSNADNTKAVASLAQEALSKAEEGAGAVGNMVDSMNEINVSSNRIADIIEVMNNIAFQTNLLALNASIEAARAGEMGKGFAVVAVEVRKLAKRSDKAAGEISSIIKESNKKVEEGVHIASDAGTMLEEINNVVKKVTLLISEVSASSQEQLTSVNQIDQTLSSLDENTQHNASLVEQAAAATEELSAQAEELNNNMNFFKLTKGEF